MTYTTKTGKMCFTGCLENYLRMVGSNLNEADMIFSGKAQIFYHKSVPTGDKYLELECLASFRSFYNYYNIKYVKTKRADFTLFDAQKVLEDCIHENIMVTISIYAASLNYSNVFDIDRDTPHSVNLIGEVADDFIISDGFIPSHPTGLFEGRVNKVDLCEAWRKNDYYFYKWDLSKVNDNNRYENLARGITEFVEEYLSGEENYATYSGIYALEQMAIDIKNTFLSNHELYMSMLTQFSYDINIYGFCASKELLVVGLNLVLNGDKHKEYRRYITEAENIAREWYKFTYFFLYYATVNKQEKRDAMLSALYNLVSREKELFITLKRILREEILREDSDRT